MRDTIDVMVGKTRQESKARVEKILTEAEFACLASERNNITYEIGILKETQRIVDWGQGLASEILCLEVVSRQKKISNIDKKLSVLRQKLAIETPTIHTEL